MAVQKNKPTPVLTGAAAIRFNRLAKENQEKKADAAELKRILALTGKIKRTTAK